MKNIKIESGLILTIIVIAALSRLIPHIQNFSPLCALGLFGAAYFDKKWKAYLIPILATFLSDIFLSRFLHTNEPFFYEGIQWVYLSYLIIVALAIVLFRKITWIRIISGSLLATLVFYLVTNAACWPGNPIYTQDIAGFTSCMLAGLPFIQGSLYSNLFFTSVFFGGYQLFTRVTKENLLPQQS